MTLQYGPDGSIICFGASLPREPLLKNLAIIKSEHFANNPGNVLGLSVASHPVNGECGRHNHRGMDEIFYVTAGTGIVEIGDAEYLLEVGDSAVVPAGTYHNLRGAAGGDMPNWQPFNVVCIAVRARGHENDPEPWKGTE